jgi:hypothetical protein
LEGMSFTPTLTTRIRNWWDKSDHKK